MKMYYWCVMVFLLLAHSLSARLPAGLDYDFASHAAQQGDWEQAQKLLDSLLVDFYDSPDLLYDRGIVSYQNGDLQKACTYFFHAAACKGVPDKLCEQAHFNAGNIRVVLDELEDAIEQYEKVLAINPANTFAQHNLDKVKEMFKKKQEQEEEQKQKDENQQQGPQQDAKNNQNNSDQKNKKESRNEQKTNNQQEQNNQSRGGQSDNDNQNGETSTSPNNGLPNKSSQDCDEKDEQRQQTERGTDGKEREQKGSQQNRRDQRNGANDKNQGYRNNETNDKPKEQPHNKQQNKTENHNFTSEQQDIPTSSPDIHSQNKRQEQKKQDIVAKQLKSGNTISKNDPDAMNSQYQWINAILEKQAEKDKQANKKIMEKKIQKECAGKYGQNCW